MRNSFLLLSFLLLGLVTSAQPGNKHGTKLIKNDTVLTALKKLTDSATVAQTLRDSSTFTPPEPLNPHNFDYILQLQNENRQRQKRNSLIRIGFGLASLVVLIIGLRRKRKK